MKTTSMNRKNFLKLAGLFLAGIFFGEIGQLWRRAFVAGKKSSLKEAKFYKPGDSLAG